MSTAAYYKQWFDEVWNKGNEAFIDEMMHKNVIIHGLDPQGVAHGIESFKTYYQNLRNTFPNITINITPLVHDQEFAAGYCMVSGRTADYKEVSFGGICVSKFKDGKIIEAWNSFDFLKMYQQLGHILVSQIQDS